MKILYFASFRERLNRGEEEVELPGSVETVGDLIDWLSERDEGAALAFARRKLVRSAVDAVVCDHATPLAGAKVVALFPPMTAG